MMPALLRPRVLVVDDDPAMLRVVSRVLGHPYEVACASSGPDALKQARTQIPDMAILDIRMPEMNGFELMRLLQADHPGLDVILMTGDAEEPDRNLVQAITSGAFYFIQKPFDRRVLLALVSRCLELRQLRQETHGYVRRLEKDLEEARLFQMSLLPPPRMDFPGLSIAARYVACHELAGDFYDYAVAGDGSIALMIADVVGHGTSAAMMTGVVKSAFHAAHVDNFEPLCVLDRVKSSIQAFEADRFLTLCSARLDLRGRRLSYVNAGHPPVILRRPGREALLLESTGPLISSALSDLPCGKEEISLREGDFLLFYTDGVTEASGGEEMFGQKRILTLMSRNQARGMQLLDEVLTAVSEFSGGEQNQDDITLLAAELAA